MERHFHEELGKLKDTLVAMAELAETMIDDSIRMLSERDASLAASIDEREDRVNRLQCEVDDMCTRLIALHQPTASDLRFILGCVKTNTDLERMADEAVSVSHKASRLKDAPPLAEAALLTEMAAVASGMVRDAIRVYVSGNSIAAREVIQRDEKVNALKREIKTRVQAAMREDPSRIPFGLDAIMASRNVERIGDHVKNIAENAIFIAEGKDVRHHFSDRDD